MFKNGPLVDQYIIALGNCHTPILLAAMQHAHDSLIRVTAVLDYFIFLTRNSDS